MSALPRFTDPVESFRTAMAASGLRTPDTIVADGNLHRFHVDGDKPRSKNGWYVLHPDSPAAGAYGSWKHDITATWCDRNPDTLTPDERAAFARRMDEARKRRDVDLEMRRQEARDKAALIWAAAPPAPADHPYLVSKRIQPHIARLSRDALVIPVRSPDGVLQSLQFIAPDGSKLFLSGGMKRGCYATIGKPGDTVLVAEGFATAASLHESTGHAVAIAFDAGNLEPVAQALRLKLPTTQIIIAADNDDTRACRDCGAAFSVADHPDVCPECGSVHRQRNVGVEAAAKAAAAVGGTVVAPDEPGDWNDAPDPARVAAVAAANDNVTPVDLFAEFPAPEIDRDMLPAAISDYAFDAAALIGASPAMIAMPALVACAAALHDGVRIQPKRHESGWTESARLWCAVVGSPSVKKSPAIKRATRRLRKIDMELHEDNARDAARHATEQDAYKEALKAAKKSGDPAPTPPEPAKNDRMVVEDITVEALSEVLKTNARGVLCIQDELSGWFGSMDAYSGGKAGGKDRAHWLEAYNGGGRVVDRVMRGTVAIPNWSVSMIGGIQPDAIRRIAANMTDDGLMQRFMIVIGSNVPEQDRPEDAAAVQAFATLVDQLYAIQPGTDPVRLEEGAHLVRERLCQWASDFAAYPALPGGLKSHLGKWPGLFARLLLTFHAIECASRRVYPSAVEVTEATARRVERLMTDFLLPHALAYYTDILGTATDLEHARWIAGHILSKRLDVVTTRDVMQAYKAWRGLNEWRRQSVMQMLEDYGWIMSVDDARKSKRGSHTWAVNAAVHRIFAEKAAMEAESREKVRQTLLELQRRHGKG